MGHYRDDHEAGLHRADALEVELADLRRQKQQDAAEIQALEEKLRNERLGLKRGGRKAKSELVIVLGILSIAILPLLGPLAWWLANRELEAVTAGSVDSGKVRTLEAGRAFGIAGTILLVLVTVYFAWELVSVLLF